MKLTKTELESYKKGIHNTIALNMKLLADGVIAPYELSHEIQELQSLENKIVAELKEYRKKRS